MGIQVVGVASGEQIDALRRIDEGSIEFANDALVKIFSDALVIAGTSDDFTWGDEHGTLLPDSIMERYSSWAKSQIPVGTANFDPVEQAAHMETITPVVIGSMKAR